METLSFCATSNLNICLNPHFADFFVKNEKKNGIIDVIFLYQREVIRYNKKGESMKHSWTPTAILYLLALAIGFFSIFFLIAIL